MVGKTRQKNPGTVQDAACEGDHSWAHSIKPEAAETSRDTQHKDADCKGQSDFGNTPAKLLRERRAKHAPRINSTQCDLQKNSSDRNTPAIRHNSLPIR